MKLFVEVTSEEYEQLKDIHEWNKEKKLLEERNAFLEQKLRRFQESFYSAISLDDITGCLWALYEAQFSNKPLSKEKMNEIYKVLKYFQYIVSARCQ